MPSLPIAYLELPCTETSALKRFYGHLFGWTFVDWGEDYVTVHNSGLEAGFNSHAESRSQAPLAMVETSDIAASQAAVEEAGGTITAPTFGYPGGRRFHFRDPAGNELAVIQPGSKQDET